MTVRRFTPGAAYQHRRNQDVAMFVVKTPYRCAEYVKLRVRWWNIAYMCFCDERIDNVKVQTKDFDGWKRVEV